jgi:acyl carrier protein
MNSTFERLSTILIRDYRVKPESLTPDAPLDALGIDSLGTVELLWTVEDEFGIKLPSEPVDLPTVGDVVRYIDDLANSQAGAGVTAAAVVAPVVRAA